MGTDIDSILSGLDLGSLNGSTAPNSSPTGLATPVNTSGGNTNTSGFNLGGVLSGLSGLGTSAVQAYSLFSGKPATTTTAAAAPNYTPWLLGGAAVIGLIIFLTARK
jgi:hypothetical protein